MNATARVGTRRGWYHGWNIVGVTILTQIAANGMAINANSLFLRKFSEDMHAPISSFLLGLMGVGIVSSLLAPFVGRQADKFPARSRLLAGLFILVVLIPAVLLIVRDRPTGRDGLDYLVGGDGRTRPTAHGAHGGAALRWREVFSRRNFWVLVVAYVPMLALHGAVQNNLGPIANSAGLTDQAAATLLGVFSMTYVCSTLLMGALSDKFGNRVMLCGLGLVTGVGALIVAFGHGQPALIVGVLLVGVNGGMWPLMASAISREFGSAHFGSAFGMLMLFVLLDVIAPVGVAVIKERTGSYVPGLAVLAGLTIVAGFVSLMLRERARGEAGADVPAFA